MPRTSLSRRIKGGTAREHYNVKNTRLSIIEEQVLIRNIQRLNAQGLSPSVPLVKEIADAICKPRSALLVGTSWLYSFITRTLELSTMLRGVYEC